MKRYLSLLLATLLFLAMALPTTVAAEAEFSTTPMVLAGGGRTFALRADGTVWAWGCNWLGQLGDGTTIDRHTPVQVQNLSRITAIAGGGARTFALRDDGTVWMWEGFWADEENVAPLPPAQVEGLPRVTAIAAGGFHALVLAEDGTVWAWGMNSFGQLGDGTREHRQEPAQVQNLSNITAITAGAEHSVALRDDGTVWAWGLNGNGQLGDGRTGTRLLPLQSQGITNVTQIAAGSLHTLALQENGTVWAWGSSRLGELGDAATSDHRRPAQLQSIANVTSISAGSGYSVALRDDGTVWVWGWNGSGQLGDGTQQSRYTPTQVRNLSSVAQISAGGSHTAVLHSNGTVWAWGGGQIGDGISTEETVATPPTQVLGPEGVGHFSLTEDIPFAFIFHDIPLDHWARDAVEFAHENSLMQGTAPTVFAPDTGLSRAMLVTILYRLANEPGVTFRPAFTDVRAGQWYSDAIIWAYDNEIVFGVAENRFAPSVHITREQFAVMLHRYAATHGVSTSVPDDLDITTAPDYDQISTWAEEAIRWAMYHGIITGVDTQGRVDPSGTATRAQAVVMLHRFIVRDW